MKLLATLALTVPLQAGIVWEATFLDSSAEPVAVMSIDSDTRHMSITVLSPWDSDPVGWTSPGSDYFDYWFNASTPPVVAVGDMPSAPDNLVSKLKLWQTIAGPALIQDEFTASFAVPVPEPETASAVVGALLGLVCGYRLAYKP